MGDELAAIQSDPLSDVRVAMLPDPCLLGIAVIELGGVSGWVVVNSDNHTVVFGQLQRLQRAQNPGLEDGF